MRWKERRTAVRVTAVLILVMASTASTAAERQPAWRDAAVPLEQRVTILLSQLTLDEQARLLLGVTTPAGEHAVGYVPGVARLGIPPLRLTDGPAGVRDGLPATAMPAPVSLAATFDRAVAAEAGGLVGREVKARGYQVLYSPMVNIVRVPQAGRNFETYGEDPHLAGQLAASYVAGVQGQRVAAQVKHVAANNQEEGRLWLSSNVDDRTLREVYLPAFETAVRQGGAWSAMCAYNRVNGSWACESFPLLNDVMRDRWGFDGAVGSDYPATHSGVTSALAGLDQEFGGSTHYAGLADAVRSGALARPAFEDNVRRVLRLMMRTGLLDGDPRPVVDPAAHAAVARRQAAAGMVLLRNDRSLLPLTAAAGTVAVSGWYAGFAHTGGKGSSHVTPYPEHTVTPLDGLRARVGAGLTYTPGSRPSPFAVPPESLSGLRADYYANRDLAGTPVASTAPASIDFDWAGGSPAPTVPADNWSARFTATLAVPATGAYDLAVTSDDGSRLYLDGALVVDNWGDHATRTRSTRIPLRAGARHQVRVEYYEAAGDAGLRFGWYTPAEADPELRRAVEAARAADGAVVVVGDDSTEGADRPSIDLPGNQDALVSAITAANANTVVVLETGGPVTMPWLPAAHTVLQAWYPGEQGGHAVADVLFGAAEPGGRLPVTFPTGLDATPIASPAQYPGEGGVVHYAERLRVGYRWYDATGTTPLFPFGHGLSYTTFRYANLAVAPAAGQGVSVSFDVTNTGGRAGSAVPQVYVGYPDAAGEPPRQLRGFAKVAPAAGATTRVSVELDRRAFAIWDEAGRSFRVPPGTFAVTVGASSRDLRLTGTVTRQAERIPEGATGQVVNAGSCLDVADANDAPGTPVQLWACNGTAAQRWTVTPEGAVKAMGRCLAPAGDAVVLADCAGQRWAVADGGPLESGGRCLDSSTGALRLAPCTGGAAQTWQPPRPADRVTGIAGQCVDVDGGSTVSGTVVWLFRCNGTGAQDWKLDADGSVRALGKCLDVANGVPHAGTPVQLWDCNGTGAQRWRATPGGALVNALSDRCLDARDGMSADFTRVQIWDCNGTAAQTWVLPRR
ncbi:glycoside hydrolase family 3 C-terminal domain-containing protein [Saccharothrix luteola]|uniref:glycoside hydrolase family 3 C-terminal domain-containing protein n=1 Tax=Saccharothrix luteola TaxID=2893018 RepID=UPI001E48979B|nr:glycoside hydrolase family 3 C-terminal domain-containing protein [Saccharothrix luteola]MCC8246178.1 glycoside hydrolase family 3 C-terminal domain-containing protein [Saccharothrix luteola]